MQQIWSECKTISNFLKKEVKNTGRTREGIEGATTPTFRVCKMPQSTLNGEINSLYDK